MTPIEKLRLYRRVTLMALWTVPLYLTIATSRLFRRWMPRVHLAVRMAVLRTWARGVARILGMRIETQGTPPAGAYLQVSNHLSDLDIIVFAALQGVAFVSRDDLADWTIAGPLAKSGDTIFIRRERLRDIIRVGREITGLIAMGIPVHVFAEGGISRDGHVHEFKGALLHEAAQRETPIHFAAVSYKTHPGAPPASASLVWRDNMSFAQHVFHLMTLPGYTATVVYGGAPIVSKDRRALAEELTEKVRERFIPLE